MSFSENIEYLMAHPGAVAVIVCAADSSNTPLAYSGNPSQWRASLSAAIALQTVACDDITVLVGEHTILAECRGGERIAIVYPTATPISKVIRRLLRKAAGSKRAASRVIADKPSAAAMEAC